MKIESLAGACGDVAVVNGLEYRVIAWALCEDQKIRAVILDNSTPTLVSEMQAGSAVKYKKG